MNEELKSAPPNITGSLATLSISGGIVSVAILFLIGFLLGFFPAVLGDQGTLAKGLDHGWKFGLVFIGSMLVGGLLYFALKRLSLPDLVISIIMFMGILAMLTTLGGIVTEDNHSLQQNLIRGLGNGVVIGAGSHWALSRRNAKNTNRSSR